MFNKKNFLLRKKDDFVYIEQTIEYTGFGEHRTVYIDPVMSSNYLSISTTDNIIYVEDGYSSYTLAKTHLGLYSEPFGAWESDVAYFRLNLPHAINGDITTKVEGTTLIDSSEYDWCLISTDSLENPTVTYKIFGSDIKARSDVTYEFNIYEKDKKYAVTIYVDGSDVCYNEVYGTSKNVRYLTFIVAHKDVIDTLR